MAINGGSHQRFAGLVLSIAAAALGCLLALIPPGRSLEEGWGLKWLFIARGARPPPEAVTIVSLDRNAASKFDLPDEPEKWPRGISAELIRRLHRKGASLIVFNVVFNEPRSTADDTTLAQAMHDSGSVVLAADLKRGTLPILDESGQLVGTISVDSIVPPIPMLAKRARAISPFPLPKDLSHVKQFWLFMDGNPQSLTLPAALLNAFFLRNAYDDFISLLRAAFPEQARLLAESSSDLNLDQGLRVFVVRARSLLRDRRFREHLLEENLPQTPMISPAHRELIKSWLAMYRLSPSVYFNHYGPAGTIHTVSIASLLDEKIEDSFDYSNKVVFVGFSDDLQPEKNQGFYTYFSSEPNNTVSSVELAATAFANLLDRSTLKPLSLIQQLGIFLVWPMLVVPITMMSKVRDALSLVLLVCLGYAMLTYFQFRDSYRWIPYVIPLFVQTPFAIACAAYLRHRKTHEEHRKMHHAFSRYVPEEIVHLAAIDGPNIEQARQIPSGVCLATDAGQYTTLAEAMEPMSLGVLMNQYYATLFPVVKSHGGIVSDVVGDAMLAVWIADDKRPEPGAAACRCALFILKAVEHFNLKHEIKLPIRIGINSGSFRLGNVGCEDHFEFRAMGDTVNTASRIENLNKRLGTRILVAEDVLARTSEFCTRELGTFLLEGKARPVTVHELLSFQDRMPPALQRVCETFAKGLDSFRSDAFDEAEIIFSKILLTYPGDGPSSFYLDMCRRYKQAPPEPRTTHAIAVMK